MGFFFRQSASFGPFRLNFSRSGVGASFGVKGARLTMKPGGTTYITVGSYGFYYRETISQSRGRSPGDSTPNTVLPGGAGAADDIVTANVSELVDSSSETLIASLNERARMFNPAFVLYAIRLCDSARSPRCYFEYPGVPQSAGYHASLRHGTGEQHPR
jgi:uncharacterized protein DUF4236